MIYYLFQNPSKAIPLGTNVAIAITTFVYLAFCVISGCTTRREVLCMYFLKIYMEYFHLFDDLSGFL